MKHDVKSLLDAMSKKPLALDDIPEEFYHAFPAMSASGLKEFRKTPKHWKYARENPSDSNTPGRIHGKLVHMMLNEPARVKNEIAVIDGHRGGKEVKAQVEAALAAGKLVCKSEEFKSAKDIYEFVHQHELASKYFKDGVGERSFFWNDPKTGAPCKARLDRINKDSVIVDVKTFDDICLEDNLENQIRKMFYHFQNWFYREAFTQVYGAPPKDFVNVFVQDAPLDAVVVRIADQTLEEVEPIVRMYLAQFAECVKADQWPASPAIIRDIVVKPWGWAEL
jgi:hypothetical protein